MTETENKLIEAATATFMRYGFRRTTMGDIAKAARVSRQTLYATYANKEDVLAAAMRELTKTSLSTLEQRWARESSLEGVLGAYNDAIILTQFDMIQAMPDSEDLISGLSGASKAAITEAQELYSAVLSRKIEALGGLSTEQARHLAEFFVASAKGLKTIAEGRDWLSQQLAMLCQATIAISGRGTGSKNQALLTKCTAKSAEA